MDTPRLSVVTPVFNDPAGIKITLESLIEQSVSEEMFEVLVVDNGSTDNTREVIEKFASDYPELIHHHQESRLRSSYAARNRGIREAEGDFIGFLDADMFVDEDWVESVVDKMNRTGWRYVGCNVEVLPSDTSLMSRYSTLVDFPISNHIEYASFAPTCSLLTDAKLFSDQGLFDARLVSGGDIEFGWRVHEAGISQHFASDITVYHPALSTVEGLVKRSWRIGRGFEQLSAKHPELPIPAPARWKMFVPPHPVKYLDSIGSHTTNVTELILFYIFEYISQLSKGGGRINEWITN